MPINGAAVSTNKDLSWGTLKETFDSVQTVTLKNISYAGKTIDIILPLYPSQDKARWHALAAIGNINKNIGKMTLEDINVLRNINKIVLSDSITRSGVDEATGTFHIQIPEMMRWSVPYFSNNIAHDSFHVAQFKRGGTAASRSTQAEVEAIDFQLKLATMLGVSKDEQDFLRRYQNDAAAIDKRRLQPM